MKTKISRFICAITLTVIQVQTSNAQDLQKIANLHLKATTQEKRSEIRSIFMEVREIYDDGHVTEYSIIKKKPNKIRIEGVWEGKNYIKAFDGIRGWTIAPWTGVSIPQLMTEGEIEEIRNIERIDSPIFESLNEGHQMSLIEDKMINGERFYCVRVVASHRPVVDYLINKNDYLLYKSLRYNINNIQELSLIHI